MGILNIFKSRSQDIPPPPPLEDLPNFPLPEEISQKTPPKLKTTKAPMAMRMEDIAAREETKIHEMESLAPVEPFFIKLEEFKGVLDEIGQAKGSLDESVDVISRLEELKHFEDGQFEKWKNQLKDIHHKLIFIDQTLFRKSYQEPTMR